MNVLIAIKNGEVRLSLEKKSKIIDEISFVDGHNLTKKLLSRLDELLRRNKLQISEVEKTNITSNSPDSYTTTRIAKTVANSINWAVK